MIRKTLKAENHVMVFFCFFLFSGDEKVKRELARLTRGDLTRTYEPKKDTKNGNKASSFPLFLVFFCGGRRGGGIRGNAQKK